MARRREVPTRNEVTTRNQETSERMEEKECELETITSDVEMVRQTLEKLDFGGTREGAEELETSMEEAEDVTVEVFDTEEESLEEIQGESQEFEEGLEGRHDSSESDLGKIGDASANIRTDETVKELLAAKESLLRDIDFLTEQADRASDAREKSNAVQEKLQARVHSGKGRW